MDSISFICFFILLQMDPNRFYYQHHWLTQSPNKKKKKRLKPISLNHRFDEQVLDTFCFHWPDMKTHVLVRVLQNTIAILPVQSQLASVYFNQPTQTLGMFDGWQQTLGLTRPESDVTLSDVLADEQGWIHAACQVDHDPTHIQLTTENTTIDLIARSAVEKTMFINLVKFYQSSSPSIQPFYSL